jgi:hypothetical protein
VLIGKKRGFRFTKCINPRVGFSTRAVVEAAATVSRGKRYRTSARNGGVAMLIDPSAFVLIAHLATAVADKVPTFNLRPSCAGASQVAVPMANGEMPSSSQIMESCLNKERDARAQLVRRWTSFDVSHRQSCVRSTSGGGIPSYIELLTCLEIADQAQKLPDRDLGVMPGTRGAGPTTTGTRSRD